MANCECHNQMLVFEGLQWSEISKDQERQIKCSLLFAEYCDSWRWITIADVKKDSEWET